MYITNFYFGSAAYVHNVVLTLLRYNLKTCPIDQHTNNELAPEKSIRQVAGTTFLPVLWNWSRG